MAISPYHISSLLDKVYLYTLNTLANTHTQTHTHIQTHTYTHTHTEEFYKNFHKQMQTILKHIRVKPYITHKGVNIEAHKGLNIAHKGLNTTNIAHKGLNLLPIQLLLTDEFCGQGLQIHGHQ